jgi:hypothetical protein
MRNNQKKRVFFDCNVFDYFYYRETDPFKEIPKEKYKIVITAEIRKEILEGNKPERIRLWAEQLLKENNVPNHPRFGYVGYGLPIPEGITGFTSYDNFEEAEGSMLSYEQFTKDGDGKPYLSKGSFPTNDSLLATHTAYSIVLSCDGKRALRQAYKQGYNLVYLGNVNPEQEKRGFDLFNRGIDEYITWALNVQKTKRK